MIDEIRIMSKNGANIFSGKIDLESNTVEMSDTDVLFAGFISAILSVSEELQNSDIRELGYQESKIIFTMTENLIFLGFVDSRVPNKDILELLDEIIRKWMLEYNDDEYPFVPDEMRANILNLIQTSIRDVFWWAAPTFNLRNNVKYVRSIISKPSGSYFVKYLPNMYLITSGLLLLVTLLGSALTGTAFIGFASGPPDQGTYYNVILATSNTLLLFTIGTGLVLKIFYRNQFSLRPYIMITSIYSILLGMTVFFTSNFWINGIYLTALNAVSGNLLLIYAVEMFVFFAPFNMVFFGYIVFSAYATSTNQAIETKEYLFANIISLLFIISISQFISTGLLGVIPVS